MFNQVITPDGPIELERPALVHEMSVKISVLDWLTWHMERMKGLQWLIGGHFFALGFAVRQPGKAAPPLVALFPPPHTAVAPLRRRITRQIVATRLQRQASSLAVSFVLRFGSFQGLSGSA